MEVLKENSSALANSPKTPSSTEALAGKTSGAAVIKSNKTISANRPARASADASSSTKGSKEKENGIDVCLGLAAQDHDESQYLSLIGSIIARGAVKSNRTGVDTKSLFGAQMRCVSL